MSKPIPSFNPSRFADQIDEALYARAWGPGARLKRERKDLVTRLRKKANGNVPADGASKPGNLTKDRHQRNVRRWKEALGRAGVTWFIGGSDWSLNEHDEDRYPGHWSHHLYGFAATTDPEELKKALQNQFPKSDVIPRPVKVQPWDGERRALRYMLKREFWRRIGTDEGERFDKTHGEQRSCRATDKQPLPSARKRELLLHLDELGLQGRLMLRWLQIVHLGGVGSALVERKPKGSALVERKPKGFRDE
jgi:hypothetical protein